MKQWGVKEGGYIERSESYLLQISSDIGTDNNNITGSRWGLYQSLTLLINLIFSGELWILNRL